MNFNKGFENVVYNCDCKDLMNAMIGKGIKADWAIIDPPYGIQIEKMNFTQSGAKKFGSGYRRDYSNIDNWDNQRLSKDYFDLLFQCSKNQIIFGGNYYADILPTTKSWIVWDKRIDNNCRNDFADCELAWCSKGVARVFHYLYNGMLQGDMKNKDERFHPTQKPTQLINMLLDYYTQKNDLIFDGFMGSFTTAISCHKMQRRFVGAELNKEYYDLGSKRLEKELLQISMFDLL